MKKRNRNKNEMLLSWQLTEMINMELKLNSNFRFFIFFFFFYIIFISVQIFFLREKQIQTW